MGNDIDLIKKQLKDNIQKLVDAGDLKEAKELIEQYKNMAQDDVEAYSMDGVVLIMEEKFDQAEQVLKEGLSIDEDNFDLNYNLGYVYEKNEKFNLAFDCYEKAKSSCNDEKLKEQINSTINEIKDKHPEAINNKLKLVFFVKQGMDSFLGDIIDGLSDEYITKKVIVTDYKQIDKGMEWADICWFEWCDELVIYGSKLFMASEKKIICRLHSYEAFTDYPSKVNWNKVDKLIFVAEHIKKFVIDKLKIDNNRIIVIPNGIDTNRWNFKERKQGYNIAYVGYINYKKGPMLLLHVFKAIYDKNHKYKLYIAGKFQDDRDVLYFRQMTSEFGIEKNVIYEGWQNDLDRWLDDKNYILCTSILESQNISVMQVMAKGIKPIVHNFVGAKKIYPKEYVWNTIDDAVHMISEDNYNSKDYRKFIEDNYSLDNEMKSILKIIDSSNKKSKNKIKNICNLNKKEITLVYRSYSGSNTIALYKLMPNYIKNKYNVNLIKEVNTQEYLETIYHSDFVVTTHGNYLLDKKKLGLKQKVLDLWHGLPAKAMGYLDKKESNKLFINHIWDNIDYLGSYSQLYNELLNNCIRTDISKYKIIGAPRNDLLISSNGKNNLKKIFDKSFSTRRIIFYMPTFRETFYNNRKDGNRNWNNIFDMKSFNDIKFNDFMHKNNIILVIKLHPNEEPLISNIIKEKNCQM